MKRLTISELESKAAALTQSNKELAASARPVRGQGDINTLIAKEFVKTNDLVLTLLSEVIALRKELGK